jgi:hypothetical protein
MALFHKTAVSPLVAQHLKVRRLAQLTVFFFNLPLFRAPKRPVLSDVEGRRGEGL